jgi:Zn-dependent metalloprotease
MRRFFICVLATLGTGLSVHAPTQAGNLSDADDMAVARRVAEGFLETQGIDGAAFRNLYLDELGQAHVRYDQTYRGVPVFGAQAIVHVTLDEEAVLSITDGRRRVGAVDVEPTVTARSAQRLVKRAEGIRGRIDAETQLVVFVQQDDTRLAWRVNLVGLDASRLPIDWVALVDAHSGEILVSFDNLHSKRDDPPGQGGGDDGDDTEDGIAVLGTADTLYFGTVALPTEAYEDTGGFGMRDPSRGGSYTTDMLDKRTGDGELFTDDDNWWGDFTNLDRATAGADAHFSAAVTWDYYLTAHGREGIYDDGVGVLSRVHFGRDYVNAFWSGACQCVTYGDGDGVTADPLVAIDIVAHELTHGVTAATADLIYMGESGGLNESLSDIFAVAAEFYAALTSDTVPDYWLGEDVWTPGVAGDALRYMDDPSRDGRSIDHYADYTSKMDVHYSSGLANHVFYLMSVGGPHASTGEVVTAIGRDRAEQVFYRALAAYMTPDTDFLAARAATMQAAADLYGSEVANLVGDAWAACGVE